MHTSHAGHSGHAQQAHYAQHEQRGSEHGGSRGREDRGRGDRGDHRMHHRYNARVDRGGRTEILFEGAWFGCDVWPEWIDGDIYFAQGPDSFWYVYEYGNPRIFVRVNIL